MHTMPPVAHPTIELAQPEIIWRLTRHGPALDHGWVHLVGEDEVGRGVVSVRDMAAREQEEMAPGAAAAWVWERAAA